jgi:hypothetical protein
MKKLIVFDLDGTLAASKTPLDAEMAKLLGGLLTTVKVAVISGGSWKQFETQLLSNLPADKRLKTSLSCLPVEQSFTSTLRVGICSTLKISPMPRRRRLLDH